MFSLSALPLPSAVVPSAVATSAMAPLAGQPLDSAGIPAESGDTPPALGFDALLALQAATPLDATPAPPPPAIPAKALQQTGKILPDAATALAALLPQTAASATDETTVTDATEDATENAAAPTTATTLVPAQPDPAMIAAIFAAPQRLAAAPSVPAPASAAPQSTPQIAPQITPQITLRPQTRQTAVPAAAATVALARTAVIEQVPAFVASPAQQLSAETPAPVATAQTANAQTETTQTTTAQAAPQQAASAPRPVALPVPAHTDPSDAAAQPLAEKQDTPGDAAPAPDLAIPETATPAFTATAPTAPDKTPTVSPVGAEARPERIDFATLVDNLNRAREDASPRSINVAVTNTDFGRVSLRFDQDDSGLSVAMSSADPGFARAVTATAEAANASNTQQDAQPKPQTGTTAQGGDASRQQSQQHNPQQAERAATATSARNPQGLPPGQDEPATDSGIYA